MRKIIFCLALLIPILTFAQGEDIKKEAFKEKGSLFKGYVALGFNLNQIDGDNNAGFKSIGANVGVGAFVMYTKKFSNSLEISYSMRGAKSFLINPKNAANFSSNFQMDYIEIPLLFNYHDFKIAIFSAGFSYNQLIRNKYVFRGADQAIEIYNWDIDLVAGVTFLIKDHWGINFKFNYSLLNNRKFANVKRGNLAGPQRSKFSNYDSPNEYGTNWYHNVISFRGMYLF